MRFLDDARAVVSRLQLKKALGPLLGQDVVLPDIRLTAGRPRRPGEAGI